MTRKPKAILYAALFLSFMLGACSTNEATGRSQFTGLMNTQSELRMGAAEQQKAESSYGVYKDKRVQAYVNRICGRLQSVVERQDVRYRCTVLDSPAVNAFALPGGYINITRGALAYANSESEVAGVLAHEMGHVAARHISERYGQGTLAQLGAAALSISIGSGAANQLFGLGSNLYMASYSRSQESEADGLGVRYLAKAGYDTKAMARFLSVLEQVDALEAAKNGQKNTQTQSFFATHPLTRDRIAHASQLASATPTPQGEINQNSHFDAIDGMIFGTSPKDGYVANGQFVHPGIGFAFEKPNAFNLTNMADKVVGQSASGAAFIFDVAGKKVDMGLDSYIAQAWMRGAGRLSNMTRMEVHGMRAATAQTQGRIGKVNALIRVVAIEWRPDVVFRFTFAMPEGTTQADIAALKRVSYSLHKLSPAEKAKAQPARIDIVKARANDSVARFANKMPFDDGLNALRFRALNNMKPDNAPLPGHIYKTIK